MQKVLLPLLLRVDVLEMGGRQTEISTLRFSLLCGEPQKLGTSGSQACLRRTTSAMARMGF